MKSIAPNLVTDLDCDTNGLDFFERQSPPLFESNPHTRIARDILQEIFLFRRSTESRPICNPTCPSCYSPHLDKVVSAVNARRPLTFVLPAFPGKSPNRSKVLGSLPDMAEQLALQFLQHLCDRIRSSYAPGAQIILCSDGRVFSDIIGMSETDVTDYQRELTQMIKELGLKNISTFNLDELGKGNDFVQMRTDLMKKFGMPLELLKEKVLRGSKLLDNSQDEDSRRMYCGLTRFLVEDATFPGQTKSRSAIQKECRLKAYEVLRRSNAWTALIAQRFPEAVRLSIHPQTCGSKKLGIRLIGAESWMTPWHGVAVKTNDGFVLLKRIEAEALGANLVYSAQGRPSHFELLKSHSLIKKSEVKL